MINIATIQDLRAHISAARLSGKRIGCVPTMGALHAGHLSLMQAAKRETDYVVTTIFVNPTQFGADEDLSKYPRPLQDDLNRCREAGVDLVFHPEIEVIYPCNNTTFVEVPGLSEILEGSSRPGHFRGVTTVVLKLLHMVLPDAAYFGRKDYQQQLLIRRMVRDLNVPVEIRTCPTVRDPDGLAMSSRNTYLNRTERRAALELSRSLEHIRVQFEEDGITPAEACSTLQQMLSANPGLLIDYATIVDSETLQEVDETTSSSAGLIALVAAQAGSTRLIDNQPLQRTMRDPLS